MSNEKAREYRIDRYPANGYLALHEVDGLMQGYADQECLNSFQSEALAITENQLLKAENASLKELVMNLKEELTKRASAFPLKDGVTFAEGYSVCAKEVLELLTNNQQSDE